MDEEIITSNKKIIVYRTHIEVLNYHRGDCPRLEKNFSIWDFLYHRNEYKGLYLDKTTNKLYLPRGIDIFWLERLFQVEPITDYSYDEFASTGPIMLKYRPRDDTQQEALKFMVGAGPYKDNLNRTMLSINLPTGKGKTYCSIASMAFKQIRSIVITNNKGWLDQWYNFFLEYTDIQPNEIHFIAGSSSIMKLMRMNLSSAKVFLVTHQTLQSYAASNGWEAVGEFFKYAGIGIKFFDEAHLSFDNMCMIDFFTNTFLTYYITATPLRSDSNEDYIYQNYFKNVPSINLFDKDEDPHTRYIALRYQSHPTPIEITKCKNDYGLNRPLYTNYLVKKENFHYLLHIIINMIKNKYGKFLIYIGTNEAVEEVKEWIIENYPYLYGNIGIYTSLTTTNKEAELSKKIILSTTKSAGAAMDIKGLVATFVLAEPFKSGVLARQTLGRTRDKDTSYYEAVDDSFYYTKKFYNAKKPIFKKYATDCTEIKLSDDDLKHKAEVEYAKAMSLISPIRWNYSQDDHPIIHPIRFNNDHKA